MGFATMYKYNDLNYKLIYSNHQKRANNTEYNERVGNERKMKQAINRARGKVFEYAYCNTWDYFITLTIDPSKHLRDQLDSYHKALTYFIKGLNKHRTEKIKFLLVPELHSDKKSWHLHGLIAGLTAHDLTINANCYLDWAEYTNRFGYCSLSPIRNSEAVSKYILKYIGKGFNDQAVGSHLYFCSRGLKTKELMATGFLDKIPEKWDYENEFCKVLMIENADLTYIDKPNDFLFDNVMEPHTV